MIEVRDALLSIVALEALPSILIRRGAEIKEMLREGKRKRKLQRPKPILIHPT